MNSEILYSVYKEAMNTDGFIITAYYATKPKGILR